MNNTELVWGSKTFQVLGIEFDTDLEQMVKANYNKKIMSIENLLNQWRRWNLTPLGWITVLKSLALSKIVHLFISLPTLSKDIINKFDKLFFEFVWKNSMSRVKKKVLPQEYIDGRLKMVEIENFDASMKISWVKKILQDTDPHKWLKIRGENIDIDKTIKLGPNYALLKTKTTTNPFWKDVFKSWKPFGNHNATTDICKSILWCNENIQIDKKNHDMIIIFFGKNIEEF